MRQYINQFINSKKEFPVLLGFASGFQPLLYLYNNNFDLVNSWPQFLFLVLVFIVLPILTFLIFHFIFKGVKVIQSYKSKLFTVLNFSFFTFFIVFVTYGLDKKKVLLVSLFVAFALALMLHKHIKKVVVFQLLLASLALIKLIPTLYDRLQYSYDWQNQADAIEQVKFKNHPNIYVLQPDGLVGFDEIYKGYYNFDNTDLQSFLQTNNFQVYSNFRSNYMSTLTSNSSMFSMKHHFYGPYHDLNKFYNARQIIVGKNPVLDILKNNNYKTHLILDAPYLISNRPEIVYDYCNINFSEIKYVSRGFEFEKDTQKDLLNAMEVSSDSPNFYFVRQPYPGHIQTRQADSKGKDVERNVYLDRLKESNQWLTDMVSKILDKDHQALIVISSDHGGFVGLEYTRQHQSKTMDRDLIYSMFSSALAIKWPDNEMATYNKELKSSVNLFRVLFASLSEDDTYLNFLEDDSSFINITKDAPTGIYEVINDEGEVVFNRFSH